MIVSINLASPRETVAEIARRAKLRRLEANLTQEGLAERAQLSLGTLKLFERTGKASIEFIVALAFALNAEKEFDQLFRIQEKRRSLDDVTAKPIRVRGRRK
jgi:transcriptional regulator with XRE-family HTH domain